VLKLIPWGTDGTDVAMDMNIKIRMDPLLAIRQQEEAAKRKVRATPRAEELAPPACGTARSGLRWSASLI
jgi:hypothetical protein